MERPEEEGMGAIVLQLVCGGTFVVVCGFVACGRFRRRRENAAVEVWVKEPRTLIEVLHTPEQVEGAARRAATYERTAAARATDLAARYEALADVVLGDAPRVRLELLEAVGGFEDGASTAEESPPRELRPAVGEGTFRSGSPLPEPT
jgi:hypothetical protein